MRVIHVQRYVGECGHFAPFVGIKSAVTIDCSNQVARLKGSHGETLMISE